MNDLRFAFRQLIQKPGYSIIAVLALALGIGANAAIFSVINAVLLQPLPYPDWQRLVLIREKTNLFDWGSVAYPNFLDWRAGQRSFTDIALIRRDSLNLSSANGQGGPERVQGTRCSWNFLSVLGLKPRLGRDLSEAEDVVGGPKVALIGERVWQKQFGGAPTVLGQHIRLDGVDREIIGVLPKAIRTVDVLVPLGDLRGSRDVLSRGNHPGFSVYGRLRSGVSVARATDDLNAIAAELERLYPDNNTARRVTVRPLLENFVGDYRHTLRLLLGAVGCVLLIACANVANLQLARALSRSKELAVRAALGASRWRLARQLLTESTLLAVMGGACGILLAVWSMDAIHAISPAGVQRFQETHIDWRALGFTAAVAIGAGVLVGLWPALRVSRTASLAIALHEAGARGGSDGAGGQRTRSVLVVTQVALAVVLLAGAGLTLKSFWRAQQTPLGFDPHGVLTMTLSLPKANYESDAKITAFYNKLVERVRNLPGVENAAIGSNVPFDNNEWDSSFHVTGTPPNPAGQEPAAEVNVVSPEYFQVMRMPILRGRTFDSQDVPVESDAGKPRSVIIDESFAQRFFPGRDPVGQHIDDNQTPVDNPPPLTIVGVVPRTRNEAPGEENVEKLNLPQMYMYSAQHAQAESVLLVRAKSGDPLALVNSVKHQVQAIDPDQPVAAVATMDRNIADSLSTRRLTMTLLGAFAALALVLATVGLYGVMALSVNQRTREMGIRLALGAARADVFRLILGQGIGLIAVGIGLGVFGALAAGRALASLLYGVGAVDVSAFAIAISSLALTALLACFFPARKATRVDPMVALREE